MNCIQCDKDISNLSKYTSTRNGVRQKRKFCGRSCSATNTNRSHPKRKPRLEEAEKVVAKKDLNTCHSCREFTSNPKFCNTTCAAEFKKRQHIEAWLAGDFSRLGKGLKIKNSIREYILNEANHKCSQCGWAEKNPTNNHCYLEIDHIDGNWANPAKENLRVLCPNCHTLTPTYRNLNIGNNKAQGSNVFYKRKLQELEAQLATTS